MNECVYIAGPMRGIPKWNFPAFDAARNRWKCEGWDVVSPADLDRAIGFDENSTDLPADFMRGAMERDLVAICQRCTAIALLPGWEKSSGTAVELALARVLKLPEFDAVTMQRMGQESVCLTADRIVGGDRRNAYGHPHADYAAATAAFNAFTRRVGSDALGPSDGVMFMMCVKLSREGHKHKLDNLVDLCGYARCKQMIEEREAQK